MTRNDRATHVCIGALATLLLAALLGMRPAERPGHVTATSLAIVDAQGRERIVLSANLDVTRIVLRDPTGAPALVIDAEGNVGSVSVLAPDGHPVARLSRSGPHPVGLLELIDPATPNDSVTLQGTRGPGREQPAPR